MRLWERPSRARFTYEMTQSTYLAKIAKISIMIQLFSFSEYCKMFNGNVQTSAKAVTCPVDAGDVSKSA
jgi:hypothetical protein